MCYNYILFHTDDKKIEKSYIIYAYDVSFLKTTCYIQTVLSSPCHLKSCFYHHHILFSQHALLTWYSYNSYLLNCNNLTSRQLKRHVEACYSPRITLTTAAWMRITYTDEALSLALWHLFIPSNKNTITGEERMYKAHHQWYILFAGMIWWILSNSSDSE